MTDIKALINRVDEEIAEEVERQKSGWADLALRGQVTLQWSTRRPRRERERALSSFP